MYFDFGQLSTKDRYKILSYTIVPRPIAWVVTVGSNGDRNAAPFSFFNVMTSKPPVVSIGITSHGKNMKDTMRHIEETRQFVVCLVPQDLMVPMNQTAIEFPPGNDELSIASLEVVPSTLVKPPRIAGCPVAFECELFHHHDMGTGQHIVLGKVLAAHVADEAVIDADKAYIDTTRLGLIGRLNNRYIDINAGNLDLPRISLAEWEANQKK